MSKTIDIVHIIHLPYYALRHHQRLSCRFPCAKLACCFHKSHTHIILTFIFKHITTHAVRNYMALTKSRFTTVICKDIVDWRSHLDVIIPKRRDETRAIYLTDKDATAIQNESRRYDLLSVARRTTRSFA